MKKGIEKRKGESEKVEEKRNGRGRVEFKRSSEGVKYEKGM